MAAPTPAPAVEAATPFNPFDTAGAVDAGIPVVQAIDEVFGGGAGAAGAGAGAAGAGAGAAAASTVGNEASARYWESVTIPLSEIHILEKIGALDVVTWTLQQYKTPKTLVRFIKNLFIWTRNESNLITIS